MRNLKWYHRLADVPGVGYTGSSGVSRARLPGHDSTPRVETFDFDGRRQQSLRWSGGTTSASPASQHMDSDLKAVPTAKLLSDLTEALELPGEPQDYHFAIQSTSQELWRRRRDEPPVLEETERLFWLDIRLIEACPNAVTDEYNDDRRFYEVRAFRSLILLYQAEGAILEALDVARRAARFDQQQPLLEELETRLAVLRAEDGT
jgi:hypothetical protein